MATATTADRPPRRRSSIPAELNPGTWWSRSKQGANPSGTCSPANRGSIRRKTGDYRLRGCAHAIVRSGKSLSDLFPVAVRSGERFEAEWSGCWRSPPERSSSKRVGRTEAGDWRSKITPQAVVASALGWICAGHSDRAAGDRQAAERYAAKMLYIAARRRCARIAGTVGRLGSDRRSVVVHPSSTPVIESKTMQTAEEPNATTINTTAAAEV